MRKTLTLLCMLLFAVTMFAQSAHEVTRTFSPTTGSFTRSNGGKTYHSEWKSTELNPQLTISTSRNDMWVNNGNLHLYQDTYNVIAPSNYVVKSYKFKFRGYQGTTNENLADVTVQAQGKNFVSHHSDTAPVAVELQNVNLASATFKVVSGNIVVTDFEVTLVPSGEVPLPVETVELVNGQLPYKTVWYALRIGGPRFNIAYTANDENIVLNSRERNFQDENLWCFVGNKTDGFRIYNRKAGLTSALVAPKDMTQAAGGMAFVQVRQLEGLDKNKYIDLWNIEASANIKGVKGFYLVPKGTSAAANNRDFKLAFWTGGRDAGSTFTAEVGLYTYKVSSKDGTFSDAKNKPSATWDGIWTSSRDPHMTLECANNNMQAVANGSAFMMSGNHGGTYTLAVNDEWGIADYAFKFTSGGKMSVTPVEGGAAAAIQPNGHATVRATGLAGLQANFNVVGTGRVDSFYVSVRRYVPFDGAYTRIVFNNSGRIPYRIPAITQKPNGELIAVADYRYGHADIGLGPVDLHYRISKDNGRTWGEEFTNLGKGDQTLRNNHWRYAFGDAAIVADRTSDNVLVLCASGHVFYSSSSRQNPLHVVRFRSKDGGRTWDEGENITDSIYGLYDHRPEGPANALFITSGRIMQSRYVKVKDYYRLYVAHPMLGGKAGAYVLYSDDFGDTWHVLGGTGVVPCSGNNESKVEELPDGSVLLSTRVSSGGRMFNIYTYTDSKKAEGSWGREGVPTIMNASQVNSSNGAILIVPVLRKEDNKKMFLALQTVPQSTVREKVGFFYKELAGRDDYKTVQEFVKNWHVGLRVTDVTSCYSSMIKMDNDSIALLYEDGSANGGYDILFKTFSVDSITGGQYTIDPAGENRIPYLEQSVKADTLGVMPGKALGMVNANEYEKCKAAFAAQKTQENMEALRRVATLGNTIVPGRLYRFRNIGRSNEEHTTYLSTDKSYLGSVTNDDNNLSTYFIFEAGENNGWKIKSANFQNYVKNVALENQKIGVTTFTKWRQDYYVNTTRSGATTLVSTNPGAKVSDKPALSMQENGNVVPAAITDPMATWEITPVEIYVDSLFNVDGDKAVKAVCLPFAYRLPEGVKAYKVTKGDAINDSIHFAQLTEITEDIPAEAPVLWMADKDNHKAVLSLVEEAPELTGDNLLQGTIREKNVDNMLMLETREGKVGFYAQTDNTLPANGVYLDKAVAGNLYALLLDKSVNTGIAHVAHQQKAQTIYNLNGQRINKAEKGIYIINGKKVYQ